MKHEEEVNYRKYDSRKDFVKKDFYETVVPILTDSKEFPDNVIGTGFLMNYDNKTSYVVTAKHVLRGEQNPNIMFTSIAGTQLQIGTSVLESFGVKWIHHPDVKDLSIIPLILPKRIDEKIRNRRILRNSSITPSSIKNGTPIKHVGYGGKNVGKNGKTGQLLGLPGAAIGTFDFGTKDIIKVRSPALEGDSGSPLFVNRGKGISIIGVITRTKPLKTEDVNEIKVKGNTEAVPINHLDTILNSKQMKNQVQKGLEKRNEIDNILKFI